MPGDRADREYRAHRDAIDTCLAFRRTARVAIAACDRYAAAFELTDPAAALLLALRQGAAMAPSRLADRIGLRRSSVSMLLKRLERDGWIERSVDRRDRRRRIVRLTEHGRRRFDILLPGYYWITRLQLAGLSASERADLHRLLKRIHAVTPPPPPRGLPEMGIPFEEILQEWSRHLEAYGRS